MLAYLWVPLPVTIALHPFLTCGGQPLVLRQCRLIKRGQCKFLLSRSALHSYKSKRNEAFHGEVFCLSSVLNKALEQRNRRGWFLWFWVHINIVSYRINKETRGRPGELLVVSWLTSRGQRTIDTRDRQSEKTPKQTKQWTREPRHWIQFLFHSQTILPFHFNISSETKKKK